MYRLSYTGRLQKLYTKSLKVDDRNNDASGTTTHRSQDLAILFGRETIKADMLLRCLDSVAVAWPNHGAAGDDALSVGAARRDGSAQGLHEATSQTSPRHRGHTL